MSKKTLTALPVLILVLVGVLMLSCLGFVKADPIPYPPQNRSLDVDFFWFGLLVVIFGECIFAYWTFKRRNEIAKKISRITLTLLFFSTSFFLLAIYTFDGLVLLNDNDFEIPFFSSPIIPVFLFQFIGISFLIIFGIYQAYGRIRKRKEVTS